MTRARPPRLVPITIAGSDPTGMAGVEADLKVFLVHGFSGAGVITALTTQGSQGVTRVDAVPANRVFERLELLFAEFHVAGVKTGLFPNASVIEAVARVLRARKPPHLVVDPVLAPTKGAPFLDARGRATLLADLLPLTDVLTPNVPEAALLTGSSESEVLRHPERATALLRGLGARAVVLKGGHADGATVIDLLDDEGVLHEIRSPRIRNRHSDRSQTMHGSGCHFSATLLAERIAGKSRLEATRRAGAHVRALLRRLARTSER